jgi:coenzyme F420-reducing hydrogenase alpha subunit
MMIYRASDFMSTEDRLKMESLKKEYSKLSTSAKRMREIGEEMKALVAKVEARA